MNYLSFDIDGTDTKELTTRLYFDIATARNSGFHLAKFTFNKNSGENFHKAIVSRLREIKKKGKITFFVNSLELSSSTTEAQYLLNKFPELKSEVEPADNIISYFVML